MKNNSISLRLQKSGNQRKFIQDIFHLTYMHIASIIKVRLPVTTYFADLSSTYGSKGFILENMEGNSLPFV